MQGDLLIAGLGDERNTVGRACVAPSDIEPAMVKADCFRFRLNAQCALTGFIAAQLTAGAPYDAGMLSSGSTRSRISLSEMATRTIALPPLDEQSAILAFLDRQTAKIDVLMAEQQRLIELLREKRLAVISHAVTKGLNSNAPMKNSGIEWLGEVPEHWVVVRVGHRYEVQLGRMLNEERSQGENMRPYLRVLDVQWNAINVQDLPEMDFPPDAQVRYRLRPGDLLVNEGGSYVGRSAIWHGELEECYYQKALHRLRPYEDSQDTAEFFLFLMEMATQLGVFVAGGNQTTIDHLTAEQLRSYRFAFPPLVEQREIALHLRTQLARLQSLTSEAEAVIALLQERRAALISAAVTGKIDVRGLVETNAPAPEMVAA
jgi:type I restriction enzyme S subunit